jgi:hypothetical protein
MAAVFCWVRFVEGEVHMKLRSLGILLALAAALSLTMACGGGDNSPSSSVTDQALRDYFQGLSGILNGVDAKSNQLNSQYPNAGQDPDQTRQYLSQFQPVANTALNDIKNLTPPSTVKDLHDRFVSALEDVLAADATLSSDVQSINTAADMKAYFDSHQADFAAKTSLVNSVCSDLQTQANSKNVAVDLKCTRTSSSPAATPAPGAATP